MSMQEGEDRLIWSPEIVLASLDFQRLLREHARRPQALLELSARQFEEFIAEVWRHLGYEVELTKRTRDGGYDIAAIKQAEVSSRFLIECKRYAPDNHIGVSLVRELYAVKLHQKATKGILATTSHFTGPAEEFIEDHYWELEGRDGDGVMNWVKQLVVP
jgi:restriction endonuclease Mrr